MYFFKTNQDVKSSSFMIHDITTEAIFKISAMNKRNSQIQDL